MPLMVIVSHVRRSMESLTALLLATMALGAAAQPGEHHRVPAHSPSEQALECLDAMFCYCACALQAPTTRTACKQTFSAVVALHARMQGIPAMQGFCLVAAAPGAVAPVAAGSATQVCISSCRQHASPACCQGSPCYPASAPDGAAALLLNRPEMADKACKEHARTMLSVSLPMIGSRLYAMCHSAHGRED